MLFLRRRVEHEADEDDPDDARGEGTDGVGHVDYTLGLVVVLDELAGRRYRRDALPPELEDLLRVVEASGYLVYVVEFHASGELVPWQRH